MNDKRTSSISNIDWQEYQKQYMDAWKLFIQPQGKSENSNWNLKMPWEEIMNYWLKSLLPSGQSGSSELFTRMFEQSKTYYLLGEHFRNLLQGLNELNKSSEGWQDLLNEQFSKFKSAFLETQGVTKENMYGVLGAWQLMPMDTLQRTFSSASVMPGDFFEDLKPEELQTVTDKFLSVPGIGYTRESQEQIQKGIKLWNEYQRVSHEFNVAQNKVAVEALEAMRLRILEMAENGEEINSLREIYDLWVDCNEKSYAEYVHTDEYSEVYGRMTNALMALKQHGRHIVDETLSAFNMPTRRGMNTIQKRQQELRRRHAEATQKIKQLEKEMHELREFIADNINTGSEDKITSTKIKKKKITTKKKKSIGKKVPKIKVSNRNKKTSKKTTKKKPVARKSTKKVVKDDMIVIKI